MLAFLTMTVRIVAGDGGGGGGGGVPIRVRIVQDRGTVTTLTNVATETNSVNDVAAPQLLAPPPDERGSADSSRRIHRRSRLKPKLFAEVATKTASRIGEKRFAKNTTA